MKTRFTAVIIFLLAILLAMVLWSAASRGNFVLFHPHGTIALQERNLIFIALSLMMIIVVPVFIATAMIAYRYRATNKSAKYSPNWDHSLKTGFVLWLMPTLIIAILAVINWQSTHKLDPFKPLDSKVKPITIQVVALRWKWLFIYPELNIATVNFIEFPAGTPVNFKLTADAPMSSFWIPALGGQMYAMAGMTTQTHLMAADAGTFEGSAAEINGVGFAGMNFKAIAVSQSQFNAWVVLARQTPKVLSLSEYNKLAQPTENNPESAYSAVQKGLYDIVVDKYMMPTKGVE